jgi:hypothetical protein
LFFLNYLVEMPLLDRSVLQFLTFLVAYIIGCAATIDFDKVIEGEVVKIAAADFSRMQLIPPCRTTYARHRRAQGKIRRTC